MLDFGTCLRYYKRKEIQEAMVEHALNKEVGLRYGESFGKRPDILMYPQEILELAKRGATSFHTSEEIWSNPKELNSELSRKELDELRIGWDLVLDIDCKFIDYSKICAHLVVQFLKYCGVENISCKFSGNKGFHLGVPFEAFPQEINNLETKNLFPEAPKKIAFYLKENIKEQLAQRIMDFEGNDFSKIMEKTGAKNEEIIYYQKDQWGTLIPCLNVEPFLEIDTILIASRHLYRMPYSLHEKSGLVSVPIDPEKVLQFEKNTAHPDLVSISPFKFLDREKDKENITESARRLLLNAWDFEVKTEEKREAINPSTFEEVKIESPIKEDFFPPCIKQILANGMTDGRKRAVFILMNFLGKIGWEKKEIESYILKWNAEKNKSPLPENYIRGQVRYFTPGEKLPPNCDNEAYYKNLGVCHPDALCGRLKNPVNYTILRWKRWLREKEEEESKGKRGKSKDSVSKRELEKEENKKDKEED